MRYDMIGPAPTGREQAEMPPASRDPLTDLPDKKPIPCAVCVYLIIPFLGTDFIPVIVKSQTFYKSAGLCYNYFNF